MINWLERAEISGDVLPAGTSLPHVHAGISDNLKKKILYLAAMGLATWEIINILGPGYGHLEGLIDRIRNQGVTNEYVESLIDDEKLTPSVMEIPQDPVVNKGDSTGGNPVNTHLSDGEADFIGRYIGRHEGFENKVYNDSYGNPTIGIGHKIKDDDQAVFDMVFGDGVVDKDKILSGQQTLTDPQVISLFQVDVAEKLATAKRIFPKFDSYSKEMKAALLSGVYRGEHKKRYRTTDLINAGKYPEAAYEYLRNTEYQNAKRDLYLSRKENRPSPTAGIPPRMEENARIIRNYRD